MVAVASTSSLISAGAFLRQLRNLRRNPDSSRGNNWMNFDQEGKGRDLTNIFFNDSQQWIHSDPLPILLILRYST